MPEVLAQFGRLLIGQMAGSNHKAAFIVKTLRGTYIMSAAGIAAIWYSAYRNERVEPGSFSFPFPGVKKLRKRFPPDRPEKEFPQETPQTGSNTDLFGTNVAAPGRGQYVYPFTNKATVGRIDQGQDFGGTGPIYSPGHAKVIKTGAAGWPGGNGVVLQLLEGPRAGQFIFIYEGIQVEVRPGQTVQAGQRVGSFIPFSSTGIEIGFCDANGVPLAHSEYTEGKVTRAGKEMAAFLSQLRMQPRLHSASQVHAKG